MAQILPHRGWLITFTAPGTVGDNPLGAHYRDWTLSLFSDERDGVIDAPLREVVVRPEIDADVVRSLPGVESVVAAWYVGPTDVAYHPCLDGRDLNGSEVGPCHFLWTGRAEALAALARQHERTRFLLDLHDGADALVRSLAGAVLDGDEDAHAPLADALTERDHPEARLARRFSRSRPEALHATAWGAHSEGGDVRALFPDGRLVVASGPGDVTTAWEIGTGRVVHTWAFPVLAAAVSPRGDQVAFATAGQVRLCPWPPGGESTFLPVAAFAPLHFSPDGHLLAGRTSEWFWVRDLVLGYAQLPLVQAPPRDLAFSANGRLVAVAHGRGVSWWRSDNWAGGSAAAGPLGCHAVAVTPDGLAVVGLGENQVHLWRVEDATEVRSLRVWGARRAACSPDGRLLAVGTDHGDILLLELPDLRFWASWRWRDVDAEGADFPVEVLTFLTDGTRLLAQASTRPPVVWSLAPLLEA